MAIARVQQKDSGTSSAAGGRTSRSLTFTSTPTEGNLLIFCVAIHTLSTISPPSDPYTITGPSGWTEISESREVWDEPWYSGNNTHMRAWYKVAGASESSTVSMSISSACEIAGWAAEYSGVDTSNPIDQAASGMGVNYTGNNHAVFITSPVPETQDGAYLYFAAYAAADAGTQTHTVNVTHHASGPSAVGSNPSLDDNSSTSGNARIGLSAWEYIASGGVEDALCTDFQMTISSGGAAGSHGIGVILRASGESSVTSIAEFYPESIAAPRAWISRSSASSTNQSHNFADTSVAGNLLVFFLCINSTTITATVTSSNWTQDGPYVGGGASMYCFWKESEGDASVAWTLSSAATSRHVSSEWGNIAALAQVAALNQANSTHSHRCGFVSATSIQPGSGGRIMCGSRQVTASEDGVILWFFVASGRYMGSAASGYEAAPYTSTLTAQSSSPLFSVKYAISIGGTKGKFTDKFVGSPAGTNTLWNPMPMGVTAFKIGEAGGGGAGWMWAAA